MTSPLKKSLFPESLISLPQLPQYHPRVPNRSSIDPLARGPSTEGVLRHGGVPRQSSARGPRLQGVQCHPRVPNHLPTDLKPVSPQHSSRSSPRRPYPQCPQWHPRVPKHHRPTSNLSHPSIPPGTRHGDLAYRYFRAIPTCQTGHLSTLRHGNPAHRCLSGILAKPL